MKTDPRAKPQDVKAKVIVERGYKHLRLAAEHVAEIDYQPVADAEAEIHGLRRLERRP